MSSGDKVVTQDSPKTVSPSSSASCSHCGSLFVHHKGCRYCLPSKKPSNVPLKKRLSTGSSVKREIVKCVVPCCSNFANKNPKKDFFYPVVADDQEELWLRAIGMTTFPSKIAICEEHFDLEADCENYVKFKYYPTKWNRLKKTVIPTKFPCKTKKSVTGSYPEHDHVLNDTKIPTKGAKKRSFPEDQSHQPGSFAKKQKVVASGTALSSKSGHPRELRSQSVAQVEVAKDESEEAKSLKDKFDFLNGDITNLIAHVQPSICSWDVSVVDVHSPSQSAVKDGGASSSKTSSDEPTVPEKGGRDEADESDTDDEDATPEIEQESSNDEDMESESTGIQLNSSSTISAVPDKVRSKLSETKSPRAKQSPRLTSSSKMTLKSNGSSGIPVSAEEPAASEGNGEPLTNGVEKAQVEPKTTSTKTTDETPVHPVAENTTLEKSRSSTSVSDGLIVVTTDEGPINPAADNKRAAHSSINELEVTCEVEDGGLEQNVPNDKMTASLTSNPIDKSHPNDSRSDEPSNSNKMDCDTVLTITGEKSSIRMTHTAALGNSPTLEMEVDSSDEPRKNVDATKAKSNNLGSTSSTQRPLTSGRVADPKCSCVLCGGTSDVPDDDSEEDDDDTPVVPQVSPRTESSQKARVAIGSENSVASSSENETDRKNVLSVRTPSIPMKRIVKPIEEISDLSEYVSEDDSPESRQSDSDSEWTPTDEERKLIPSRTTRSSMRAKDIGNTTSGRTRKVVKVEKTPTEKTSPIKNGETDSELNEKDDEGVPENLISLQVNMKETVASYRLKNSKTTYSYKQLYEGGDSAEVTAGASRSDKVLVVRTTNNDEFNPKGPLPQPMVDLLEDMKTYFDHFFEKLDKLKKIAKSNAVPSSEDVADESNPKEMSTQQCIETLEEDVKMFPALLNLEMVQFVEKCKQHFQEKLDDIGERYKKIRWCVACSEAALFHCCFKAAYCSCRCQKKHWEEHRKECAQESITLLDPHLRLNSSLMLRVKNLNKSKFTITDLEKSYSKPGAYEDPKKNGGGVQTSNTLPDKDDSKTPVVPARKCLYSPKPTVKTYAAQVLSKSTPKTIGSAADGSKRNTREFEPVKRKFDSSISRRRSIKTSGKSPLVSKDPLKTSDQPPLVSRDPLQTSNKSPSVSKDPLKTVGAANRTVSKTAATKKKNETFLTSFAVKKSVTLNSRNTSIASTLTSGSLLLPKSMINVGGITTTAGNNQVVVKFRSVTLPNGDKRLIPADLPSDQSFSIVQSTSPSSGKPATSGSILITRPAKPAYTATTGFIPLSQVNPSMSHPVILQPGINGFLTPVVSPMVTQTAAPPLPTLTPIPKQGPCSIRTLNDEELNKILNTDHLQSAFDDSYYANTRIRS